MKFGRAREQATASLTGKPLRALGRPMIYSASQCFFLHSRPIVFMMVNTNRLEASENRYLLVHVHFPRACHCMVRFTNQQLLYRDFNRLSNCGSAAMSVEPKGDLLKGVLICDRKVSVERSGERRFRARSSKPSTPASPK